MSESSQIKRQILGRTLLFGALADAEMDHLAAMAKLLRLPARTPLFFKGDPGDRLYIVVRGVVRISTVSADGRETTLNLMGPGQMFGEIAVLDGGERTADASVIEDCEMVAIERRDLLAFLERNPRCSIRMLAACSDRLRWVSELLEDAQFLELPARLAKRLLLLSHMFGQKVEDGVRIGVRLSQRDLAAHMTVRRESVNKQLNDWEREGLIRMGRGWIVVLDHDALDACAALPSRRAGRGD